MSYLVISSLFPSISIVISRPLNHSPSSLSFFLSFFFFLRKVYQIGDKRWELSAISLSPSAFRGKDMASTAARANRFAGGAGEEQEQEQSVFLRGHRRSCYHVPQQSRREKLRFPTESSLSLDSSASRMGRPAHHGPFTGYAAVLGRSRFLQPARRLLEEVCQVGQQRRRAGCLEEALLGSDTTGSPPPPQAAELGMNEFSPVTVGEHRRRKTRLNCLLDEVKY